MRRDGGKICVNEKKRQQLTMSIFPRNGWNMEEMSLIFHLFLGNGCDQAVVWSVIVAYAEHTILWETYENRRIPAEACTSCGDS